MYVRSSFNWCPLDRAHQFAGGVEHFSYKKNVNTQTPINKQAFGPIMLFTARQNVQLSRYILTQNVHNFQFGQKFTQINHQLTFSDVLCSKTKVFNQVGGKNVLYVCRNVCTRHFCICYFAFRRILMTDLQLITKCLPFQLETYKFLDSDITFEICSLRWIGIFEAF